MKKLLLAIMILCGTMAQAIDLDYPVDKYKLANTAVMMHFDGDFADATGNTWANGSPGGMDGFTAADAKFGQSTFKHNEDDPVGENYFSSTSLASSAVSLGTGDFTIEWWVGHHCHNTMSEIRSLFGRLILSNSDSSVTKTFRTYINRQGTFWAPTYKLDVSYVDSLGTPTIAGADARGYSSPPTAQKWWHICHERRSGILYSYIDGIEVASGALALDMNAAPISNIYMSVWLNDHQTSDTYLDELRITKGRYIYGGAFTPVEKPFREWVAPGRIGAKQPWFDLTGIDPKVSSLLRYDEITGLVDSAAKTTWARTTLSASLGITSEAAKFGASGQKFTISAATSGSMRTDAATMTPFLAGTGDFTMSYWIRLRSITESTTGNGNFLNNLYLYKSIGNYWIQQNAFYFTAGNTSTVNYVPSCQLYVGNAFQNQLAGSTTLTAGGAWKYITIERVAGVMTIYVDGVVNATGSGLAATYDFSATNIANAYFGHSSFNAGSYGIIDIDEFMFFKGGYVYGAAFTPPTTPLGTTRYPKLWTTSTRYLPQQTGYSYAVATYVNCDAFAFPIDPGSLGGIHAVPVYSKPALAISNGGLYYTKCAIATGSAKFGTYGLSYKDSTWTTYGNMYCLNYNDVIRSMTNQVDFWFRPDTIRQPASAERETLFKVEFCPNGRIKNLSYEIMREGAVNVGTTASFTASLRAIYYNGTNSGGVDSPTFTMNAGQWYHLRFERATGWAGHYWVTGYLDGVQVMQVMDNYVANGDLSWVNDMVVGNWGTRGYIDYSVDDILYKKVPASISPFTPPTEATLTTSEKISFLKD